MHLLPGDASLVLGMVGTLTTSGAQSVGPETHHPETPTNCAAISCQTVGPLALGLKRTNRLSATLLVALTHGGCAISASTEAGNHLLPKGHTKPGDHPTFLRNGPLRDFCWNFLHQKTPWISLG